MCRGGSHTSVGGGTCVGEGHTRVWEEAQMYGRVTHKCGRRHKCRGGSQRCVREEAQT